MFYFTSVAVATFALRGQKCMEMKVHLPKS